jgi:hypothetical protein
MRKGQFYLGLFLFSLLSLPMILADTSTVTVSVDAYTAITLSSEYVSGVGFGDVSMQTYGSGSENGNGVDVHSGYYVNFIGNTLGNVTWNCSDFVSGVNTLTKDNFMMNYANDTDYASADYNVATNFTSEIEYGNLVSNTTIYSNYFVYVPYLQPAGDYNATLTISVEAA